MSQFSKSNLGMIAVDVLPIGFIFPVWNSNNPPPGTLELDGSSLLKATYADLYAGFELSLGDQFGNADGASFFLPDFRGRAVRGWDNAVGRDPDAASRTADQSGAPTGDNVGSCQDDELESHVHEVYEAYQVNSEDGDNNEPRGWADVTPDNSGGVVGAGTENVMKNMYVIWVIKY
jgi:microcystin-dependent protein